MVTDAVFEEFLDISVTPRFPAGLTVFGGSGRWLSPNGRQVREASRMVLIVAPATAATRVGLDRIRAEYATRFGQQSVGLLRSPTCAAF